IMLRDRTQQWVLQSIRHAEVVLVIVIGPLQADVLPCEAILEETFLLLCREVDPLAQLLTVYWNLLIQRTLVFQFY
ncbi:LysR family transcriptional regulator, partial [Erwinia amylovora]|nr:LysR family transcriptional regulator [Erwinia amylovora]